MDAKLSRRPGVAKTIAQQMRARLTTLRMRARRASLLLAQHRDGYRDLALGPGGKDRRNQGLPIGIGRPSAPGNGRIAAPEPRFRGIASIAICDKRSVSFTRRSDAGSGTDCTPS